MKILVYSNMYPSTEIPYAGIYVKNQFEYLRDNYPNILFQIKTMERYKTNKIKSTFRYLKLFLSSLPLLFKKFDVIHVHFLSLHFLFPIVYKIFHPSSKILLTLHGSDVNRFPENRVLRYFVSKILSFTKTETISVGKKLASNFKNKFYLTSSYVIAAGVDDTVFVQDKKVAKNYDFIFVGSFTQIKGIDNLIKAIENTPKNLKWCFIGLGPYIHELNILKKRRDISIYNGLNHQQVSKKLNESRFFILPSRTEGFPLASIEALYCGIPVLSSNLEQFQEQIEDEYNGFIIEKNTPNGILNIVDKVLRLNAKKYEKISQAAFTSNRKHSLENVCTRLVEIYKRS